MSGLGWALRRLGAMEPGEIATRTARAIRERVAPPAYTRWSPGAAFSKLFKGRAGEAIASSRWSHATRAGPESQAVLADTIAAARRLEHGRATLFGAEVTIGDPPDWNADPFGAGRWPDAPSRSIDYRRGDVAGGVKGCWELGRGASMLTLGLAARATGDRALGARAQRWLEDFVARHPLGHGIHHTSGIEQAIRTLTHGATLALLEPQSDATRLAPALGLIAQQALQCRDHLSLGSSANNHLIAEYAAMTVTGAAFPSLRNGSRLLRAGHRGLVQETLRQIHPDGVPAEQAFGYLPFVWELLLTSFVLADAAGYETPAPVRERLAASLEFARVMRLEDGTLPGIGDEDDGRILLADERASRVDLVGAALAAWLDAPSLSDRAPALAQVLIGRTRPASNAPDGRHEFAAGGYTVWRHAGTVVTLDHGPLGLGRLAAHGHADALSITVTRGLDRVIVDPGTFAYQEDPDARDRCRSTPAHATVHFGGRSQSQMLGPFLWGRRATTHVDECVWHSGERHRRELTVEPARLRWTDHVTGRDARLSLPLGPGATVALDGTRVRVQVGRTVARFEAQGLEPWRVEAAEFAPGYRRRVASQRLDAAFTGSEASVSIELGSA
ncbi:MAG: alginate lyase family protein [Candidatus Eisenbacteria bacterium]|uniref:Alginate lyase family protein n=1 Tax=Eiseniibacteriota bacterium TaxID=2212470 RepID=A0A849SLQ7_UNCEI|nr:alginate lyase family protein [Candidatus Eisenbacteria bacterium]